MTQNMDEDSNIVIRIGYNDQLNEPVSYNVSKFRKKIRENIHSDTDIEQLNNFILKLDEKVHVDLNDPRYSHIYRGIDLILERLVSELANVDSYFTEATLHPTGSIYSGVKVGLPHEADYLLKVPNDKSLDTDDVLVA